MVAIVDELLLTELVLAHRGLLFLLLLPHDALDLAVQLHVNLVAHELHLQMAQPSEGLQLGQLVVDLEELLVDVVDYEDGRVFDGLLEDQLQVVLDEHADDLQVLAEPQQQRPHNRLQQELVQRQPKDALLKDKADPEELRYLPDGHHAELLHLLELVLGVDGLQVEPVAHVALQEVVVVPDRIHEDDAFLGAVLLEVGDDCGREGESGVALADVVDQQQSGQQFVGLCDGGDALAQTFQVDLLMVDVKGVELQYFLVNGIAFQLSPQDALSPVIHIDVVDEVHDPLHFSRIIILIYYLRSGVQSQIAVGQQIQSNKFKV